MIGSVLADRPDLANHLSEAHDAAWRAVDPVLLELCRVRIAMLLGCEAEQRARTGAALPDHLEPMIAGLAEWPTSPRFGSRERACLAFCEQFVIDVAAMPDEVALGVGTELGAAGLRNFANALLVVEQRQRLRMAWEAIFDGGVAG